MRCKALPTLIIFGFKTISYIVSNCIFALSDTAALVSLLVALWRKQKTQLSWSPMEAHRSQIWCRTISHGDGLKWGLCRSKLSKPQVLPWPVVFLHCNFLWFVQLMQGSITASPKLHASMIITLSSCVESLRNRDWSNYHLTHSCSELTNIGENVYEAYGARKLISSGVSSGAN